MVTVSLDDPQLGEHLKALLASSEAEFKFTEGGVVLASVTKVQDDQIRSPLPEGKRPLGLWKDIYGPIELAPDFADELPDSFWMGEEP